MVGIKYMTAFLVGDHSLTGPKNDHPTPPKKALRSRPSVLLFGSLRLYDPMFYPPRAQRIRWWNADRQFVAIKPPLPTQLGAGRRLGGTGPVPVGPLALHTIP